jgi:hypothetical protein
MSPFVDIGEVQRPCVKSGPESVGVFPGGSFREKTSFDSGSYSETGQPTPPSPMSPFVDIGEVQPPCVKMAPAFSQGAVSGKRPHLFREGPAHLAGHFRHWRDLGPVTLPADARLGNRRADRTRAPAIPERRCLSVMQTKPASARACRSAAPGGDTPCTRRAGTFNQACGNMVQTDGVIIEATGETIGLFSTALRGVLLPPRREQRSRTDRHFASRGHGLSQSERSLGTRPHDANHKSALPPVRRAKGPSQRPSRALEHITAYQW